MSVDRKAETKRGYQEAPGQFEVLRARWPRAFPAKSRDVRPLGSGAVAIIAAELGWNPVYARAVLNVWKRREAYCRAVLTCSARIGLDGSETGETVDDVARAQAQEIIAQREARRQREAQKAALRRAAAPSATDQPAISLVRSD